MKALKKLTIAASALVLMALATGCSKDGDNATGPTIDEPAPTKYYDVTVRLHRFHVNGDCDPGLLEGDGEISYGIEIQRELTPGSNNWVHVAYFDSKDYPKSDGTKYKRHDGEDINLNETLYVGRLEEGCDYKLIASAIEWDGIASNKKDSGMSGSPRQEVDTAGGKAHYEHKLTLGSSGSCQLFLYFDCDETPVE